MEVCLRLASRSPLSFSSTFHTHHISSKMLPVPVGTSYKEHISLTDLRNSSKVSTTWPLLPTHPFRLLTTFLHLTYGFLPIHLFPSCFLKTTQLPLSLSPSATWSVVLLISQATTRTTICPFSTVATWPVSSSAPTDCHRASGLSPFNSCYLLDHISNLTGCHRGSESSPSFTPAAVSGVNIF